MALPTGPRVVIVGGGTAGLSTAWNLIKNGITDVTILEAQDRIGGRIHTIDWGNITIDLGAQYIHGQGKNPVYHLAKENDLIADYSGAFTSLDYRFRFSNGNEAKKWTVQKMFGLYFFHMSMSGLSNRMPGMKDDPNANVGDFMLRKFSSDFNRDPTNCSHDDLTRKAMLNWFHNLYKVEWVCDSWHQLSLKDVIEYEDFGGDMYGGFKRGFQTILDLLLKEIPESCIQCDKIVTSIRWEGDSVTVSTADGTELTADHVIVTTPVGYLKEHVNEMFDPALPDDKLEAIKEIGFGTLGKIFLEFEEPFWEVKSTIWLHGLLWKEEEDINIQGIPQDVEPWYKSVLCFMGFPTNPHVLVAMVGGKDGAIMESRPESEVATVCHQLLVNFTGKPDLPAPKRCKMSQWHNNQNFLGSYSYAPAHMGPKVHDTLAEPLPSCKNPKLQFAGEATDRLHHSTVHGAMISGEREAQRILTHHNKKIEHALWKKPRNVSSCVCM